MRETLIELKKSIEKSNKTKRIMGIALLFILAILPSIALFSYAYYIKEDSGLIFEGTAEIESGDIVLKIFLQNRDSSGNPSSGYSRVYFIPQSEYSYNSQKTKCTSGVSIDSFTDYRFSISASRKGVCEVYFDALSSSIIKGAPNGTLRIMAEQTYKTGDYVEVGKVPNDNYVLNEPKTAQTCSNVELNGTKISITASSDVSCVVYVDLASDNETYQNIDMKLNIYMQDRDSNGVSVNNSYTKVYYIPKNDYTYNSSKTSCTDGANVDSFDGNSFSVTTSGKGWCDVYFDAAVSSSFKGSPMGAMRIFIEQTKGQHDYKEVGKVPNTNYVINQSKTNETCQNVTLSGTTLNVTTSSDFACKVYLDLK